LPSRPTFVPKNESLLRSQFRCRPNVSILKRQVEFPVLNLLADASDEVCRRKARMLGYVELDRGQQGIGLCLLVGVLICVGDPRKGGIRSFFGCWAWFLASCRDGGPQSGSRWSARSAARTNDLEADEGPPHTRSGAGGRGKGVVAQVMSASRARASCGETRRACRRPALSGSTDSGSGDMMMDGVPGVRAGDGCGRSFFPGSPPHSGAATGHLRELAAGIS